MSNPSTLVELVELQVDIFDILLTPSLSHEANRANSVQSSTGRFTPVTIESWS